jgi:hypothetical protein
MRAKVDATPQSARPAHAAAGTGCDRFDQGAPATVNGSTPCRHGLIVVDGRGRTEMRASSASGRDSAEAASHRAVEAAL